ncbi:exopolysaccharide biosynthesis polyprenyl glycosylphosphotransferase [Hymenobacter volaticus]|uniref:Exopolysaccharide biosynthesis polyprenyl glycosylphosphotransferase n=1 Tax=Hymenobacter volaticus TaxID=2932254 RepID=A0ABY4GD72_9BACT|nr:exopolysaccharide biosynthesis polyprenyl glycosylphosphotransferase [Hymenobacter volaticus]UOQ68834.1 exopolysaccharide biosynthesis polyprenyl glycosylphosphotransferase [Hymenobacter volaticus]
MSTLTLTCEPTSPVVQPLLNFNGFNHLPPKLVVQGSRRKRAFDLVFASLVVLFLLSWLMPLIALLIRLESKGPILFKQLRTGKNGKPFYCYKFRSMRTSADANLKQATKGDSRITKVGAFLRKTSLDELPQFINVLKGEMSVIGPRPHMLRHTEDYSKVVHNFMARHTILPGITGLAQVSGYRGETKETEAMAKRVEADLQYIENWSFALDLKIVGQTIAQGLRPQEHVF